MLHCERKWNKRSCTPVLYIHTTLTLLFSWAPGESLESSNGPYIHPFLHTRVKRKRRNIGWQIQSQYRLIWTSSNCTRDTHNDPGQYTRARLLGEYLEYMYFFRIAKVLQVSSTLLFFGARAILFLYKCTCIYICWFVIWYILYAFAIQAGSECVNESLIVTFYIVYNWLKIHDKIDVYKALFLLRLYYIFIV